MSEIYEWFQVYAEKSGDARLIEAADRLGKLEYYRRIGRRGSKQKTRMLEDCEVQIQKMATALRKYACQCSEPCALYKEEKKHEADMPHMTCGWWASIALEGK